MSPQQFSDKYLLAVKQAAKHRFSYATPVERTEGAFKRLMEGLNSLKK